MPSKPESFTSSVWLRPPRKGAGQPTLTREQIVRAAIELLDAEGLAGLSMRRLGTRLGSGATSVYWYVTNKDELLELAVDEMMGEVYVPEVGDTNWRIGASVIASSLWTMLLRHPWVIGLLGVRPNLGPNAMRIGDRSVALLTAAGFSGLEVSQASSLLTSHAIGSATTVSAVTNSLKQSGQSLDEMVEAIEGHVARLGAEYPNYHEWRQDVGVAVWDPDRIWEQSFTFGLERLLDGLELWLERRKS